ncbi:MAG: hypothetical protein ACLPHP_17170 [Candidatus Sulfotelmatobacter sp.]
MAADPQSFSDPGAVLERYHVYHAEAYILKGELKQPVEQPIEEYGRVVLEHTRREGLFTQAVGETNIAGLISFKRGHTRVAGALVKQKTDIFGNDHAGWVTLSTAALEGYNVEDIVTADRVVAQLSTQHPMVNGHVPRVNFLGTRFENLRIGGYPVEVELDLTFCGAKPEGDRPYLQDGGFLDRVHRQLDNIVETGDLPESLEKKYGAEIAYIDDLKQRAKDGAKIGANGGENGYPKLRCSLVKKIKLPVEIPGVRTFGNAIFVRDFGTVYLAELEVGVNNGHGDHIDHPRWKGDGSQTQPSDSNYFKLNMLDMQLGCPSTGKTSGPGVTGNGQTQP